MTASSGTGVEVPRRPGRPRSAEAERVILATALEHLIRDGVGGLTIEAVAAAAGVAKTTIYRRWPSKEELVIDALGSLKPPVLPQMPEGTSVRDELVMLLGRVRGPDPRVGGKLYSCLLAEAERHPEMAARYNTMVIEPRRERGRQALRRGVAEGVLRADLDIDLMLALLTSPMLLHSMRASTDSGPSPEELAASVVDAVWTGIATR